MSKLVSMKEAISSTIEDGSSLYITGFTHLIDFSAGHEIMRQGRKNLKLIRLTPDLIYDQMIAAGVASKLVFSYLGNPGVGSLHCIRRAIERGYPREIEIEEYTHGSLLSALFAGGSGIPFFPVNAVSHTDIPKYNRNFQRITDPFTGEETLVVKPLKVDVAIIHAQRADSDGNAQIWGIIGEQKEVAFASKKVIITAEEIVDKEIIKRDPNRTLIPGFIVSAVVRDPWGAHPSYSQGFYDRDNDFYLQWDKISRSVSETEKYLEDWVYAINDREEYLEKLGKEKISKLRMKEKFVPPLNYGSVT
ncbi:MAG: CoA-transferase [Candidatus Parvarchaeota archaeon]